MGKKLIQAGDLDSVICRATGKVYADGSIILTPGAKDELSRRGVAIVYGPKSGDAGCAAAAAGCPVGCTCPACSGKSALDCTTLDALTRSVSEMLKNNCHITDEEQLKLLSRQALQTIRDNI